MTDPKYIVFEGEFGREEILLFGITQSHAAVADMVAPREVISAGFFSLDPDDPGCYGKSVSLNLGSRPKDTSLLKQALKING